MQWLGLDVGGANLKLADGRGWAATRPFPLWRQPGGLMAALEELLATAPSADGLALTMTGELADCFATKREGVEAILGAVEAAADRALPGANCAFISPAASSCPRPSLVSSHCGRPPPTGMPWHDSPRGLFRAARPC